MPSVTVSSPCRPIKKIKLSSSCGSKWETSSRLVPNQRTSASSKMQWRFSWIVSTLKMNLRSTAGFPTSLWTTFKSTWTYRSELRDSKATKSSESWWSFSKMSCPELSKTSDRSAQASMAWTCTTKIESFRESFLASWCRVERLCRTMMAKMPRVRTDPNLQMSRFGCLTLVKDYFLWLIEAQTQTDLLSSFAMLQQLILMASMLSMAASFMGSRSAGMLKLCLSRQEILHLYSSYALKLVNWKAIKSSQQNRLILFIFTLSNEIFDSLY